MSPSEDHQHAVVVPPDIHWDSATVVLKSTHDCLFCLSSVTVSGGQFDGIESLLVAYHLCFIKRVRCATSDERPSYSWRISINPAANEKWPTTTKTTTTTTTTGSSCCCCGWSATECRCCRERQPTSTTRATRQTTWRMTPGDETSPLADDCVRPSNNHSHNNATL